MDCHFRPTLHAKARFAERGISRGEALEAMLRGVSGRQGSKLVSRRGRLTVVWRKKPCNFVVITAMWEEG